MILITIPFVSSLEIDRSELQRASEADIDFESYQGPVDQIDSAEAIRGIGRYMGSRVDPRTPSTYFGRYLARRVIGDPDDPRLAADLLELAPESRVDHIRNLRRIIAGYLEEAWGYQRDDADLLSRFITIYNAVYRGSISFFEEQYRSAVSAVLDPRRVGLATTYREWAGATQLVIPVRDRRAPGAIDAVDPRQLVSPAVIAELRSRTDLGLEDRKAIIAFIERVIEERTEILVRQREELEEERAAVAERIQQVEEQIQQEAEAQPAPVETDPAPPQPDPPQPQPDPQPQPQPQPDPQPDPQPEPQPDAPAPPTPAPTPAEQEREQLQEQQEELDQREQELQREEEELEELTRQVEELYQEAAEDQLALQEERPVRELVPFLITEGGGAGYELVLVDLATLERVGTQSIPLADRIVLDFQGGLLVVHRGSRRMLLLERSSFEILQESDRPLTAGSGVRVQGGTVLAVIQDGGSSYVAEFDPQLVMTRRSFDPVHPATDIVVRQGRVLVRRPDGGFRILNLDQFE